MPVDVSPADSQGRLDSWKEIAAYLGKGVRTVQRWEQTDALPVHRLGPDGSGSVFAYKSELDAWWRQKSDRASVAEPTPTTPGLSNRWMIGGIVIAVSAIASGWLLTSRRPEPTYKLTPVTFERGFDVQPAFSPDGSQIAYSYSTPGAPPHIYTRRIGPEPPTRLTKGSDPEGWSAWSPDGRLIAFFRFSRETKATSLLLIPASGGPESHISETVGGGRIVWTADSRWLVFREGPANAHRLVAVSVANGEKHTLVPDREFGYCGYDVSRDSKRLVFCAATLGPTNIWELVLDAQMRPAGDPRVVVSGITLNSMLVTPDGRDIIYTGGLSPEGTEIYRRPLRSSAVKPRTLYSGPERITALTISGDQKRLALVANRELRVDIQKLNLDEQPLTAHPLLFSTHQDQNPDYSPDGSRIAFHSTRTGSSDIWISDRDGSNQRQLTFTNARTTATPRWSPDGAWIAYESNLTGQTEVYTVRSNGGPSNQITHHPATDAIPGWSRDGNFIYFCSNRTGRFEIWKVARTGGEPVQVTHNGGFSAVESRDGKYLYYSQNRNNGPIWRVALSGGQPEQIITLTTGLFYAVSSRGLYFHLRSALHFWNAATGQAEILFKPPKTIGYGLAVSPDEKELLFAQADIDDTDIYLIDGLR